MAIDCSCDVCGKQYKLADKLAGKKVRCKACGENFTVPTVSDLLVAAPQAASSSPSTPGQQSAAPSSAVPRAANADEKYCPQCGNGIPKNYVVCTNCGYNTRTGDSGRTIVQRPAETVVVSNAQQARPRNHDDAERRYDGTRVNTEYRNGFAGLAETICVRGTMLLIALFILGPIVLGVVGLSYSNASARQWGVFVGTTFMQLLIGLIGLSINVWFNTTAVNLAGKLMKFETPDELGLRALATKVWASLVALPVVFLGAVASGAFASTNASTHADSTGAVVAAMLGVIIIGVLLALGAQFFFTWFLLRLRVLETLVAFLFICIADVISVIVVGGLFFLIALVIGAIANASSS